MFLKCCTASTNRPTCLRTPGRSSLSAGKSVLTSKCAVDCKVSDVAYQIQLKPTGTGIGRLPLQAPVQMPAAQLSVCVCLRCAYTLREERLCQEKDCSKDKNKQERHSQDSTYKGNRRGEGVKFVCNGARLNLAGKSFNRIYTSAFNLSVRTFYFSSLPVFKCNTTSCVASFHKCLKIFGLENTNQIFLWISDNKVECISPHPEEEKQPTTIHTLHYKHWSLCVSSPRLSSPALPSS